MGRRLPPCRNVPSVRSPASSYLRSEGFDDDDDDDILARSLVEGRPLAPRNPLAADSELSDPNRTSGAVGWSIWPFVQINQDVPGQTTGKGTIAFTVNRTWAERGSKFGGRHFSHEKWGL
jgi:hypothetical protein